MPVAMAVAGDGDAGVRGKNGLGRNFAGPKSRFSLPRPTGPRRKFGLRHYSGGVTPIEPRSVSPIPTGT